ncbi:hypothetical protein EXIGLDRAFT_770450 [Exidia glandulosa HHB12029]|uniref:Uncharacterized protein n=1 Tax=Exidia glandulosa HHB12029 TaxID=1314781 RepID=A0A165GNM8_EXIGL|nr:hypothetical protein EXIGLDRAFT_770450 [Exidia glandulosa HHB12029]
MSATRPSKLRRTFFADLEHIAAVQRDVDDAAQAHASAAAALQLAQAEYDATKLELQIQRNRLHGLFRSADAVRSSLQTLATFPADLLSMIFVHGSTDRPQEDDKPWHVVAIDIEAFHLPYRVAAVSRHWRQVARSTAQLWTCIRIPSSESDVQCTGPNSAAYARLLEHVKLHLSLSQAASLDLIWDLTLSRSVSRDASTCSREDKQEDVFHSKLFQLVMRHSSRIRSFLLETSADVGYDHDTNHFGGPHVTTVIHHILALLRCRAPKLVELAVKCLHFFVISDDDFWENFPEMEFPVLLPHAPNLRRMHVLDAPIVVRRPHPGFHALTELAIQLTIYTINDAHLWDTLVSAPNLDRLWLDLKVDDEEEFDFEIELPISLPVSTIALSQSVDSPFNLVTLLDRLSLPNLSSLSIKAHMVSSLTVNDALASSISSLTISGHTGLGAEDLAILQRFAAVEAVSFSLATAKMDDHALFELLCDAADPMWPRLRRLSLRGVASDSVERDGILQLVRARNLHSESAKYTPLDLVEFDKYSVPTHVAIQVEDIMGARCRLLE